MNTNVLSAVFKRNFTSYFASPTGYVFICVFVFLSSLAAFWPNEFFNANLANLDQLNTFIPFIMLFFIPAITMSIWADESRQGTDELLLTIPAGDFDIVLGKYLAALAIYSVSLLFSLICNYIVLTRLGDPDKGLFVATYFGYWMLGLAMLAVGMIASFLTKNLTVAYILGAFFNAPFAIISVADVLPTVNHDTAVALKQWSFGGQFQEFGRGIVTFSGLAYFALIVAVMLYVCMILIGRRHWMRSGSWHVLGMQFIVRALSLVFITAGVVLILHNHDVRIDATSEKLSSLSPYTTKLIDDLKAEYRKSDVKQPVHIDAYISPEVPETYVQTRLNLLSTLRELKAQAGDLMEVQINETDRGSQTADTAKRLYNIQPHRVSSTVHGAFSQDNIYLAVAVKSGLEKVVLPFIDRDTPAEYELVRSICTVKQQKRKRIGLVETDAPVFGRFSMQGGMSPSWQIVTELQKQYEVVQVSPSQPIPLHKAATKPGEKDEGFDVLLVIQPSAMGPPEAENLINAIRAGQPAVIFEDPFCFFASDVPGTSQPRHPADQMQAMFNRQQMPKGNLKPLWQLLGINFSGEGNSEEAIPFSADDEGPGGSDQLVWQNYNPYPKLTDIPPEFVFIDNGCGNKQPFSEADPISSKLQHIFFPAPGYIEKKNSSLLGKSRTFVPLVTTSANSGTVLVKEMITRNFLGMSEINPNRRQVPGNGAQYVLAAHIQGQLSAPAEKSPDVKAKDEKDKSAEKGPSDVNVVVVADIDLLTDAFFQWREQGELPQLGLHFEFDNVAFVLNALDSLAGDERFLELRKRRPLHRTLTTIDEQTEFARTERSAEAEKNRLEAEDAENKATKELSDQIKKFGDQIKKENQNIDESEVERRVEIALKDGQRQLDAKKKELDQDYEEKIQKIDDKLERSTVHLQGWYKFWAVVIPPIPPLLVAGVVFFTRRSKEREGVAKNRLR